MSTLRKLLPNQIVDSVEMQLKLHKRKRKARRYSPEIKSFLYTKDVVELENFAVLMKVEGEITGKSTPFALHQAKNKFEFNKN